MLHLHKTVVHFIFSREEVESQKYSRLFQAYPAKPELASVQMVRPLMGKLVIFIDGYNEDHRTLWEIPEVRSFMKRLCEIWPCWLYFCLLQEVNTRSIMFCRLNIVLIHNHSAGQASTCMTHCSKQELMLLAAADLNNMVALCRRTGVSQTAINERIAAFHTELKVGIQP